MINRHHYVARQPLCSNSTQNDSEHLFHEWQLLVYEESLPSEGKVSQDIRDLIERFPFSSEISVIAPNCDEQQLLQLLNQGTAGLRTQHQNIKLSIICFDKDLHSLRRQIVNADSQLNLTFDLPIELQNAWLFDLFHRHHCLVPAPEGVHFGKTSGKHSDKFLRAANVLVGSLEASLLAFFLLPFASKLRPQIIHVDTGPLVSIAFALITQIARRGIWPYTPTVESFSSYDGIDRLTAAHKDNLFLISASTSGGLKSRIADRIGRSDCIATIFYLQANNQDTCDSHILCDLNEKHNSYYGYPKVDTYQDSHSCKWCMEGIPFAEFEGDQFLLQKRKTQFINIAFHPSDFSKSSLQSDAKQLFEHSKSRGIFSIRLTAGGHDGYRDVRINRKNLKLLLSEIQLQYKERIQELKIFSVTDYAVSDHFDVSSLNTLLTFDDSNAPLFKEISLVKNLQKLPVVDGGSVFVPFEILVSMHEPRKISEILRSIVPNGTVNYFSAATIVESSEQFNQLSTALKTGARGPSTFNFEPGYVIFLRKRFEPLTTWQKEKDFLADLVASNESTDLPTAQAILNRLAYLRDTGTSTDALFWPSQNELPLMLQKDFVYLTVNSNESQADIYTIVSNLLSTAIQNNRNPKEKLTTSSVRKVLRDSIYSEALIDPNNFLKFNDAILRASILRAASSFELNYSRDLHLSSTLTGLIMHEISEWNFSRGQCLMEFLIALAIKHLRLCSQHIDEITNEIDKNCIIPPFVKQVASYMRVRTTIALQTQETDLTSLS